MWAIAGLWPFALEGVNRVRAPLSGGMDAMDAAVEAVRVVEDSPNAESVGTGGYLNRDGVLSLDAAVMDGRTLKMGAVANVTGFRNPVKIARDVMEKTRHTFLVGPGAEQFARELGHEPAPPVDSASAEKWRENLQTDKHEGHDTVGMLAISLDGHFCAATSTSGASLKLPGRVGDTPLVGSGFYADEEVGGAVATGMGEYIMRGVTCFLAVEMMRGGMSPREAAEAAVRRVCDALTSRGGDCDNIALLCMDKTGRTGAACNHDGFAYAAASEGRAPEIVPVASLYA